MHVLILGGTGTISLWIVRHLLALGRTVTVLNRGKSAGLPPGVEQILADRFDAAALAAALKGRRFDATIDMLCFNPDQARILVEALPACGHLVFCSTVCALGFASTVFPVAEDAIPAPTFGYGRDKAAAEGWLTAWSAKAGVPLTIVRPSTTFDERMGILRQLRWDGSAWLARIRAGLPIALADSGLGVNQFMHADDAGRGFALVAGNPASHGRIYHLVGEAITWAHHAQVVMRTLGREVPLVGIPTAILDRTAIPDDGIRKDIFGFHGHFADTRLAREIGFAPRLGFAETIARVLPLVKIPDPVERDGWEDLLIARWG